MSTEQTDSTDQSLNMDSMPVRKVVTNNVAGEPESTKNKTLETGAGIVQVPAEPTVLLRRGTDR